MADKGIEVGDKVQWNYGAGHPQGTVEEIKTQTGEKVQIQSQKGNTVTRNADPDNPAAKVHAERKNVDVVKRMSELEKVEGEDAKEGAGEGAGGEKAKAGEGGKEPGVGEKRVRESVENSEEKEGEVEAQKEGETADAAATAEGEGRKEKDQEPETKKAKLGEEAGGKEKEGAAQAAEQAAEPTTTKGRGRGKGRGRAKTASIATTGTRRTSTRTKKGVAAAQEKAAAGEGGEKAEGRTGGPEVVMAEASVPGEVEGEVEQGANVTAEQAPAGHTRSKDVQDTA